MFTVEEMRRTIKNLMEMWWRDTEVKDGVEFIYDILNYAYDEGASYDVSDLYFPVVRYAMSNPSDAYCMDLVNKMHFRSKDVELLDPMRSSRGSMVRNEATSGRISHGKSRCSELKYI